MNRIEITEVGPRDGLQNETQAFGLSTKIELITRLSQVGLRRIESGAFVSRQAIPQMADSEQLFTKLNQLSWPKGQVLSALVPNEKGMQAALENKIREVAVFTAASESFNQKNINCSIDESFRRFEPVIRLAKKHRVRVRGYISMAFGCPYEGRVPEKKLYDVTKRLLKAGVADISIGDTIGVATPRQVRSVLRGLRKLGTPKQFALHFHDTRGTALSNVVAALDASFFKFDSSVGGLGGCPYAPGAAGNLATEDLVYLAHGMGLKTGVDLEGLIELSRWLGGLMDRVLPSKVSRAKSVPSYIFSKAK